MVFLLRTGTSRVYFECVVTFMITKRPRTYSSKTFYFSLVFRKTKKSQIDKKSIFCCPLLFIKKEWQTKPCSENVTLSGNQYKVLFKFCASSRNTSRLVAGTIPSHGIFFLTLEKVM
jgi:hypothetical protein